MLLTSDKSPKGSNWSAQAIGATFAGSETTITTVRKVYCEGGLKAALNRKPSVRAYLRRLDGEAEVHLMAWPAASL